MKKRWLLAWLAFVAPAAATGDLRLAPLPPPAQVNAAQAELGRHLFFESRLSGDGSRSCASCHVPEKGYADGLALSRGYNGTEHFRNAPGLLSVRLKLRLMWDGRQGDLVGAVREMLLDAQFMNGDARMIAERIRQIPPLAAEGLRLFTGKAGCVQCHHGPLLSDGRVHRLGLPDHPALAREPLRTVSLLRHHAERGLPDPMAERGDIGAYAISKNPAERGAFMTPPLRGLAHTGPYMHNGRLASLEDVIDFHARGGGAGSELRPLALDRQERRALVAFLQALSAPLDRTLAPPAYDYGSVGGGRR